MRFIGINTTAKFDPNALERGASGSGMNKDHFVREDFIGEVTEFDPDRVIEITFRRG